MRIHLVNSGRGEDYLADLFVSSLLCSRLHEISSNYIAPYLWNDYRSSESLYGRGYSAFCSVPAVLRSHGLGNSRNSNKVAGDSCAAILDAYPSLVIVTSIWRTDKTLVEKVIDCSRSVGATILALDGEDHDRIHVLSEMFDAYYKRELTSINDNLLPISFKLPISVLPFLVNGPQYLPSKKALLAPCDPRYKKSYAYDTQVLYYNQYSTAFFGTTTRKGGWDCLRHYEILANHCLPFFPGIEDKPESTMADYPIEMQMEANRLVLKTLSSPDPLGKKFFNKYEELLSRFLGQFYSKCTTKAYESIVNEYF